MKSVIVYLSFIFLIGLSTALAQKTANTQSLYWVKYSARIAAGPKVNIQASIEDRRYFKKSRKNMGLYTIEASRKLKNQWVGGVGFMRWTLLMPSDPESDIEVTQGEWRPFQYLTFTSPLSERFEFEQRLMLEERIRQNVGADPITMDPVIEDGYYTYLRYRHRLQVTAKLSADDASIPVSLTLANELMVHFGDDRIQNTFDQNRISLTLNAKIFDNTKLLIGYLNWYQDAPAIGANYVLRHIATFTVTQQF